MLRISTVVVAILVFVGTEGICSDTVTLVKNGRPVSTIVTVDNPTSAAQQAAKDIQMWLWKSTGATVAIKTESGVSEKVDGGLILVGDTKRTRSLGVSQNLQ